MCMQANKRSLAVIFQLNQGVSVARLTYKVPVLIQCGNVSLISFSLVHGQVTIIFVVSVCLSVCLCRVFLSRL